jgi:hypothetical protein
VRVPREIVKVMHMSFTDIGKILKDADKRGKNPNSNEHDKNFIQAYKVFSEGKSLVQEAIDSSN